MSDTKLIYGDFFEKVKDIQDKSINLIIGDIPFCGEFKGAQDYGIIFDEFYRVLNTNGLCVCRVDTSIQHKAFYCVLFNLMRVFDEKLRDLITFVYPDYKWGNLIVVGNGRYLVNEPVLLNRIDIWDFAVSNCSKEGDLVFDPFMGTGDIKRVCQKLNRNYVGIEIVDKLYEVACAKNFAA